MAQGGSTIYGWRSKIGLIIPANNSVIEPELGRFLPDGVSQYATRMIVEGPFAPEALERMEQQSIRGVRELMLTRVNVVVYCCMSTCLVKGKEWDTDLPRRVLAAPELEPGHPLQVVSAAAAMMEALGSLDIRRPAVLTPYPPAIIPYVAPFFTASGFDVAVNRNLEIADYHAVVRVMPEAVYRFARATDFAAAGADGIAVLATDLRTVEIIETLERDTGLPVVTTNQAILWKALRATGVYDAVAGLGRLLRE